MNQPTTQRPWLVFELARVVIEFESAFLTGANEGDGLHDAVFATDANGLPAISGETLAGILRHALADGQDPATDEKCKQVFGFQRNDEGEASAVRISWAQVHDQTDQPVPFCGASQEDPLLVLLAAGLPRDHVRMGPHGAAQHRGKFDELVVPAGVRFTFELIVDQRSPLRLEELLRRLARGEVRIGRASRRGLGRLRIVRARAASFDLRQPDDLQRFSRLPIPLEEGDGGMLAPLALSPVESSRRWVCGTLRLAAADTWLIGGTIPSGNEPQRPDNQKQGWDHFPLTEPYIAWEKDNSGKERGKIISRQQASFLVPASSLKGALRHRTAFHARRLSQRWMSPDLADIPFTPEEEELFGELRDKYSGRPGRLLLSDARVHAAPPFSPFQHVCLDRFTQGPRDGLLFDELALYGGWFEVELSLCLDGLSVPARRALSAALDDLCQQRLPLGAGRSHGRFHGSISWDDQGRWMEERG